MSQEWNIRSRGHVCSLCQKPLVDRAPVVSALKETPEGYERFDCHPECWKTAERDWEPFSQWDGVYFAPVKEEKKEPLKKEDAGELLRQLVTLDDPAMKNVVYVLAVMLERSKILVERDTKELEDGTIRRVYEDRKQGDTFVILRTSPKCSPRSSRSFRARRPSAKSPRRRIAPPSRSRSSRRRGRREA